MLIAMVIVSTVSQFIDALYYYLILKWKLATPSYSPTNWFLDTPNISALYKHLSLVSSMILITTNIS